MRERLGAKSVESDAERVDQLLAELAERNDGALAEVLYQDPQAAAPVPHEDLRILVNGRSIAFLEGAATQLAEADTVTLHWSGARGYPGG